MCKSGAKAENAHTCTASANLPFTVGAEPLLAGSTALASIPFRKFEVIMLFVVRPVAAPAAHGV